MICEGKRKQGLQAITRLVISSNYGLPTCRRISCISSPIGLRLNRSKEWMRERVHPLWYGHTDRYLQQLLNPYGARTCLILNHRSDQISCSIADHNRDTHRCIEVRIYHLLEIIMLFSWHCPQAGFGGYICIRFRHINTPSAETWSAMLLRVSDPSWFGNHPMSTP